MRPILEKAKGKAASANPDLAETAAPVEETKKAPTAVAKKGIKGGAASTTTRKPIAGGTKSSAAASAKPAEESAAKPAAASSSMRKTVPSRAPAGKIAAPF